PVGNILTVECSVPLNVCCQGVGPLLGLGDRATQSGRAEYAAAVGHYLAVFQAGSGMENFLAVHFGFRQAGNNVALVIVSGVTAGSQHDAYAGSFVPLRVALVQLAVHGRLAQFNHVRFHAQHDRLGFRVAEAAVELDHFRRTVGVDHQAGVQEAFVRMTFGGHAVDGGVDHLVHDALVHIRRDYRGRRIGTHAAGVGAGIAVAYPLVVLGGGHGQYVLAVHHHDERGFFAVQEFFHHHAAAGITEGIACEHVADGVFGFFQGHGHDYAFTGGQAV